MDASVGKSGSSIGRGIHRAWVGSPVTCSQTTSQGGAAASGDDGEARSGGVTQSPSRPGQYPEEMAPCAVSFRTGPDQPKQVC